MKKIGIIFLFVGIHFSVCTAQITCKIIHDKESSSLKMTITNLYEDSPVILKVDSMKPDIEELQSFSEERIVARVDRSRLLDIELLFSREKERSEKRINMRVSDRKLYESAIAPLDSVTCFLLYITPEEIERFPKLRTSVSIPYSTVDGRIFDGRYRNTELINLLPGEE